MNSRGRWWFSMGPLGWLILGPVILCGLVLYCAVMLLVALVRGAVFLVREAASRP